MRVTAYKLGFPLISLNKRNSMVYRPICVCVNINKINHHQLPDTMVKAVFAHHQTNNKEGHLIGAAKFLTTERFIFFKIQMNLKNHTNLHILSCRDWSLIFSVALAIPHCDQGRLHQNRKINNIHMCEFVKTSS